MAYIADQNAASPVGYWHGGRPGLDVGTILIGRAEAEAQDKDLSQSDLQAGYGIGLTDPARMYFSSDREFARGFAARIQYRDDASGVVFQQGALYEVEPLGEIEVDPDFADSRVSWSAPQARIISIVEDNVRLSPYEAARGSARTHGGRTGRRRMTRVAICC